MNQKTSNIVHYILENITNHPRDIVTLTGKYFGISRPAVLRHVKKLMARGFIVADGNTRARRYALKPIADVHLDLPVTEHLKEDEVWRQHLRPLFTDVPPNVLKICQYGLTEMLNNVIDHSEGAKVNIHVTYAPNSIHMIVMDDGVGIFVKIQNKLGLEDPRHSILELAKGKLTTDPEHHTGEGIFYTSRIFDAFWIVSDTLCFTHRSNGNDWLLEDDAPVGHQGTMVAMTIDPRSPRELQKAFDMYAAESDDYGFTRTIVPVRLAKYGDENLISRSQAKRLLTRFERFREVILDFAGVAMIGQAFADEIFRVFQKQNPHVKLIWSDTNADVEQTIHRAMANGI